MPSRMMLPAKAYLTWAVTCWGAQVNHLKKGSTRFLSNVGCNQMQGASLQWRQSVTRVPLQRSSTKARHLHLNPFRSTVFGLEVRAVPRMKVSLFVTMAMPGIARSLLNDKSQDARLFFFLLFVFQIIVGGTTSSSIVL